MSLARDVFPNAGFDGRHVVVFGGTSGINLGIATAFAERGANVTVASRTPGKVAEATSWLEQRAAGRVYGACADVRDASQVAQALAESDARFGPVDVLVSGAAGNFLCPVEELSPNGFRSVVDIDLVGAFHVVRQAFTHMRRPGSSVLHISAPQAQVPMRYQAHCSAAKAGLDQLTRVLALEWGAHGIRVNGISPGPIDGTEGFRRLLAASNAQHREASDAVPLGRLGTLDDISNLALFLSSPWAGYISGAVVPCDGGGAIDSVRPAVEAAGAADAATRRACSTAAAAH